MSTIYCKKWLKDKKTAVNTENINTEFNNNIWYLKSVILHRSYLNTRDDEVKRLVKFTMYKYDLQI
jgi:4-amino-4-deoxy-L-arabinose transferase-like glycosyltransferase